MVRAVNERLQTLGPSFIEIGLILTPKLTGTKMSIRRGGRYRA